MKLIATLLLCALFVGCAFLPSVKDKLEVRPLNITPCEPRSNPVLPCGWLTGELGETEDFEVKVGWGKFREIVGEANAKHPLSDETKVLFSQFAIKHVVGLGYCKDAAWVPHDSDLANFEGSGYRKIHVRCL